MAATAENVANANTEGYVRREVILSAKQGYTMSATSTSTLGQGVQVTDVRRAFDGLVANRLWASESAVASVSTQVAAGTGLEQVFLPGADGIDAAMGEFFGGLNSLANFPGDLGLRRVVMEMGAGLAASFTEAASGIEALKEDASQAIHLAAQKVNSLLSNLSALNHQMIAASSSTGAVNPLHDQRDAALAELSRQIEVNVHLDPKGGAEVRLGPGPGGLTLLDRAGAAMVDFGWYSPPSLSIRKGDGEARTTILTGGAIGGHVLALGSIDAVKDELDQLARRFTDAVNSAHAAGLDLDGKSGDQMFTLDGVRIIKGATNAGSAAVAVLGKTLTHDVRLSYDGASGLWRAENMEGDILASGTRTLAVAGVSVTLEGLARPGDSFLLQSSDGEARDMRFALSNPRGIAAAAATIVGPSPGNSGNASVTIQASSSSVEPMQSLSELLSANPADAVSFIQPGVVGIIPAGTKSVSLASLGRQAMVDFAVADASLAAGGRLTVSLSGVTHEFMVPAGLTSNALSSQLNGAAILSQEGLALSELGMASVGTNGAFSLASSSEEFSAATLDLGTEFISGVFSPPLDEAAGIQIFTRDGRQIAGKPLSAAEAATLISSANGFSPTAQYDATNLVGTRGVGYRDTVVERKVVPGAQSLVLNPDGGGQSILALHSGDESANLTVPEAASAKRLASIVNASLAGIQASAETTVALTGLSDGSVQLDLAGNNISPIRVTAEVIDGDYSSLARAISAASGATGISAELSVGRNGILLRHPSGEDIRISNFQHGDGGSMSVTATNALGTALGGPELLGSGTTSIKMAGQVTVTGASPFSTSFLGTAMASKADVLSGNMVTRQISDAGETVRYGFVADEVLDGAATSSDLLLPSAAGLAHTLSVNGLSVIYSGGETGEKVATGLLTALRSEGPTSSVTGVAVSALPPEGSAIPLKLDGQTFILRMEAGSVVVEGPETNRIIAEFDANMRLNIRVMGGITDGIGLQPDMAAPLAASFGLSSDAVQRLEGQVINPSELPPAGQVISVMVGNAVYDLRVDAGPTVTVPQGFPGAAALNDEGRLVLEVPSANGRLAIKGSAEAAGFGSAEVEGRLVGGDLEFTSVTGRASDIALSISATASERLTLSNLPPEDLIVVLTSPGALRLAGKFEETSGALTSKATELRVKDITSGAVELFDSETGHSIAAGWLDGRGQVNLGGFQFTLTGRAATGDSFVLSPNRVPEGDARTLQHIIALSEADPSEGGGFSKILAELTTGIGAQVNATRNREDALSAGHETLTRKMAEVGSVDLDAEAARLIELQQAYQASAQALSIARQLFDTILNIM